MARAVSFFRRAALGFVAARERQANTAVAPYLLSLDDAALAALGHDRETVQGWARRSTVQI